MELLAITISITFCLFGVIGFVADWVATYASNKRGNK